MPRSRLGFGNGFDVPLVLAFANGFGEPLVLSSGTCLLL